MKTFFVDTNLFLQCKPLEELPWHEISDEAESLLLLISPTVMAEIDRLKSDGNSRRARRAKKANSLFREILRSKTKVIREAGPHVEITFSPTLKSKIAKPDSLDLSRMDDKIIYEAYVYAQGSFGVALLTHDTSPMLKAQRCNLKYCEIPDDWLLPPEPDERDKRIFNLETRVNKLEKTYPQIEMEIQDANGHSIKSLSIIVITYDTLSNQMVKELVTEVEKRSPLITEFKSPSRNLRSSNQPFAIFRPPSEEKIRAYKEKEYPGWLDKVKGFYSSLDRRLEIPRRHVNTSFVLKNSGMVPAENVRIKFSALGGLLFMPPDHEITYDIYKSFPSPPSPPEGEWTSYAVPHEGLFPSVNKFPDWIPTRAENRDRNSFYWKDRPDNYKALWVFECDEFRHQLEPECFGINLFVPRKNDFLRGTVECVVSASNLPEPFKQILPIEIKYIKGDTEKETVRLLDQVLPRITISR